MTDKKQTMIVTVEEKEKIRARKEKIGGYFLDMSKLAFASSVLGGIVPLLQEGTMLNLCVVIFGLAVTVIFAIIGNRILK